MSEVVWNKYSKEEFEDVMKFSEGYIDFLSDSKTERACVKMRLHWQNHMDIVILKKLLKIKKF